MAPSPLYTHALIPMWLACSLLIPQLPFLFPLTFPSLLFFFTFFLFSEGFPSCISSQLHILEAASHSSAISFTSTLVAHLPQPLVPWDRATPSSFLYFPLPKLQVHFHFFISSNRCPVASIPHLMKWFSAPWHLFTSAK
jgi:hypothetical protein